MINGNSIHQGVRLRYSVRRGDWTITCSSNRVSCRKGKWLAKTISSQQGTQTLNEGVQETSLEKVAGSSGMIESGEDLENDNLSRPATSSMFQVPQRSL